MRKEKITQNSVCKSAVIYVRVSSKEQEKEGFSIPAQIKLLTNYASDQGFTLVQKYVDVETAKQTGRSGFAEMVNYFKKQHKPTTEGIPSRSSRREN
jgi:DNA invertase Pin-like site-specific DNA recombinase